MEMVIAECPYCGRKYYGWSEEEVTEKYYEHCTSEHENGSKDNAVYFVREALEVER